LDIIHRKNQEKGKKKVFQYLYVIYTRQQ